VARHAATGRALRAAPASVVIPCALFGLVAVAGAGGLAWGVLDLGDRVRDGLPWDSPVLAGASLLAVVGLPMLLAAWAGARANPATGKLTMLAGGLLIGWIVVQLVVLVTFSWLQPLCLLSGVVLVALGSVVHRTHRTRSVVVAPVVP
jgi:hypothetical protein